MKQKIMTIKIDSKLKNFIKNINFVDCPRNLFKSYFFKNLSKLCVQIRCYRERK